MLKDLKLLLGFDPEKEDVELDQKLNWILTSARARLKLLLGGIEPPEELNYIITEVSVTRFNRIGSEGMSINDVEGETQHYHNSDFDSFMGEITAYLEAVNHPEKKGVIQFL